ncbi:MAG TPA: glycosyltransferase [Bryobacteraceae bacterium]|nr:glycosyltransferase [Bryobacteraceae bacterium]
MAAATKPPALDWHVTVVDNNSKDATRDTVQSFINQLGPDRVAYIFEAHPGRSSALNAGIASSRRAVIGMIDDDEEIASNWFDAIAEWFAHDDIDFIGGPCRPRWGADPPAWLPDRPGVIGATEIGLAHPVPFSEYAGNLMGGNAVIRRSVFDRLGLYSPNLGRTDKRLLSCEDHDFYERIQAAGLRGMFVPDLVIYHWVPPERLTKSYYRRWSFWRAVSLAVMAHNRPSKVPTLFGAPRWVFGLAFRKSPNLLRRRRAPEAFEAELLWWDLAGYFYGRRMR